MNNLQTETGGNTPSTQNHSEITLSRRRIVSKKELCAAFDLCRGSVPHYHKLASAFFDDTALAHIGITREEYKAIRVFSWEQTRAIIQYFKISIQELP